MRPLQYELATRGRRHCPLRNQLMHWVNGNNLSVGVIGAEASAQPSQVYATAGAAHAHVLQALTGIAEAVGSESTLLSKLTVAGLSLSAGLGVPWQSHDLLVVQLPVFLTAPPWQRLVAGLLRDWAATKGSKPPLVLVFLWNSPEKDITQQWSASSWPQPAWDPWYVEQLALVRNIIARQGDASVVGAWFTAKSTYAGPALNVTPAEAPGPADRALVATAVSDILRWHLLSSVLPPAGSGCADDGATAV